MITFSSVLYLIIEVAVLGFFAWVVSSAPIIEAPFKEIIKWILIIVAGLLIIGFFFGLRTV